MLAEESRRVPLLRHHGRSDRRGRRCRHGLDAGPERRHVPGLKPWLAALAATVANALCLPFVAGYWHTAGKPAGARWLMITQGLGLLAFGLVYLANLSS